MTLNIRYGSGPERLDEPGYDLPGTSGYREAIGAAIRSLDPDLVAVQEVRNQRQAQEIARLCGMHSIYKSHPLGYRLLFFEWGLAFLHRLTLLDADSRPILLDPLSGVGRTCLCCRMKAGDEPVHFVNVHLDHGQGPAQMDKIIRLVDELGPPVCLLGDFNRGPDDPLLAPLRQRLVDSCRAVDTAGSREAASRGTVLGAVLRSDYIWCDPERFIVSDAGLLAEPHRRVSDHVGYWADLSPR